MFTKPAPWYQSATVQNGIASPGEENYCRWIVQHSTFPFV